MHHIDTRPVELHYTCTLMYTKKTLCSPKHTPDHSVYINLMVTQPVSLAEWLLHNISPVIWIIFIYFQWAIEHFQDLNDTDQEYCIRHNAIMDKADVNTVFNPAHTTPPEVGHLDIIRGHLYRYWVILSSHIYNHLHQCVHLCEPSDFSVLVWTNELISCWRRMFSLAVRSPFQCGRPSICWIPRKNQGWAMRTRPQVCLHIRAVARCLPSVHMERSPSSCWFHRLNHSHSWEHWQ